MGFWGFGDEDSLATEVKETVWKLTKRFVPISIRAYYLDDPPCTEFDFDDDAYDDWKHEGEDYD